MEREKYAAACLRLERCAEAYAAANRAYDTDQNKKRIDDAYASMALAYYQRGRAFEAATRRFNT